MYTVLLPPGDNPIAVNKYIIYQNTTGWLLLKLTSCTCLQLYIVETARHIPHLHYTSYLANNKQTGKAENMKRK